MKLVKCTEQWGEMHTCEVFNRVGTLNPSCSEEMTVLTTSPTLVETLTTKKLLNF